MPRVAINDADVEAMIEKLRTQRATWRVVERAAAAGDRAVVDFEGKMTARRFRAAAARK